MNKYFNKQTLVSFILGGILFSSAGVFAATQLNVIPNQYPIKVDNKEVDIEGYNIDGRTYLQLRDITEILNADLDFQNNTILIDTDTSDTEVISNELATSTPNINPTILPTPVPTNTNNESEVKEAVELQIPTLEQRQNKPKSTPDGITDIDIYDGKYYIGILHIKSSIKNKGYSMNNNNNNLSITKDDILIIENIPSKYLSGFGNEAIEYDYYINKILPLIK